MSFHIITVQTHGSKLSVDRGLLICSAKDEADKSVVLADVRAIICLTPKIAFTGEAISRILEQGSLILHCNSNFKITGWSMSIDTVVRNEVFKNQISNDFNFNKNIWQKILKGKVINQAKVLDCFLIEHNLYSLINSEKIDESNIARWYWEKYFSSLGHKIQREKRNAKHFFNKALNYGYGVLNGLVYRSIILYGLCPNLGIHHKFRYRSTPLVYDFMEVFRPFVDFLFFKWAQITLSNQLDDESWDDWLKFYMNSLRRMRIKISYKNKSFKLMDAIDEYVRTITKCYEDTNFNNLCFEKLWIPGLKDHYFNDED